MKRFLKLLLITILALFILIQLYPRPKKNVEKNLNPYDISLTNKTPPGVHKILKVSCYNCHSNNTIYPWYASLQPVAWWLGDHITEGKKELNFSEFGTYSLRRKYKKLDEIIKEVEEDKMPLQNYTRLHHDAKLDTSEKAAILAWANTEYDKMTANYPADSLVKK